MKLLHLFQKLSEAPIFESGHDEIFLGYWINSYDFKLINPYPSGHFSYIFEHPEEFNITGSLDNEQDIIDGVFNSGWVRLSYASNLFVNGGSLPDIHRVLKWVSTKNPELLSRGVEIEIHNGPYVTPTFKELDRFIRTGKIKVTEAPITGYTTYGDFSEPSSITDPVDRKLITNPRMIKRVHEKFGRTPFNINMAFVNHPDGKEFTEHGLMLPGHFVKNFPGLAEKFQIQPDAINIVYTNNVGDQHVPMTPWIMAHRLSHVFAARDLSGSWQSEDMYEAYREMREFFLSTLLIGWGIPRITTTFYPNAEPSQLVSLIGTFRSARNKKVAPHRHYEMLHECFAQYVITGDIRFNTLTKDSTINTTATRYTTEPDESGIVSNRMIRVLEPTKIDPDEVDMCNANIESLRQTLLYRYPKTLQSAIGKILIM